MQAFDQAEVAHGLWWLRTGCVALQVLLLSLLFTGYLVNIAAVTPVLQWVHYLSVFFFGFESLIVNEMSGISLIFSVSPPSPSRAFIKENRS